jgi:MerR family mercuric resistance operon transcriptional regulator
VETVRYYQRRGLLALPDRAGGYGEGTVRRYSDEDVRRLKFIRTAQAAGFTLEEISELLSLDASDDRPRVRALAAERIAALDARSRSSRRPGTRFPGWPPAAPRLSRPVPDPDRLRS